MLEEIEKRISVFPKRMIAIEVRVPMMVDEKIADPERPGSFKKTGRKIRDPHGRFSQTRYDVLDADDPYRKPVCHWHTYPDHPLYTEGWKEQAEALAHVRSDVEYLISEIKRLKGELSSGSIS